MTQNPPEVAAADLSQTATQGQAAASSDLDDEISLLDLLQVVADNLRLLVLGPLAAGLLALGYTFTIAPTFTASPQAAVEGLARLKASITAQEIKLASMRGYLTEAAPDFKQAQTELFALRSQLAKYEKEEPGSPGLAGKESDYIAKFRDYKYQEALFELFAKQYEMARIDESREGAVIQVLDPAQPPDHKAKPQKALIAVMVTLATGFLLLLFIFTRQGLKTASQNEDQAEKLNRLRQSLRSAWRDKNSSGY